SCRCRVLFGAERQARRRTRTRRLHRRGTRTIIRALGEPERETPARPDTKSKDGPETLHQARHRDVPQEEGDRGGTDRSHQRDLGSPFVLLTRALESAPRVELDLHGTQYPQALPGYLLRIPGPSPCHSERGSDLLAGRAANEHRD